MDLSSSFVRVAWNSLLAFVPCAIVVTLCYFFIDQPVAFYVHDHGFAHYRALRDLTLPPPILQTWSPAALALLMIRRMWGQFSRFEMALLAAVVAMIVADQFRESLSFVFGRYWPDTWIDNNPSLIKNNAYGFHYFQSGSWYGSFPSGHMARTLGIAAVIWISYPVWRCVSLAAALAVAVGLIGMNYHFVSDVIAGSYIGSIVGVYAAYLAGLNEKGERRGTNAK